MNWKPSIVDVLLHRPTVSRTRSGREQSMRHGGKVEQPRHVELFNVVVRSEQNEAGWYNRPDSSQAELCKLNFDLIAGGCGYFDPSRCEILSGNLNTRREWRFDRGAINDNAHGMCQRHLRRPSGVDS